MNEIKQSDSNQFPIVQVPVPFCRVHRILVIVPSLPPKKKQRNLCQYHQRIFLDTRFLTISAHKLVVDGSKLAFHYSTYLIYHSESLLTIFCFITLAEKFIPGVPDDPVPPLTVGGSHSQVQIFWIFLITFLGSYEGIQRPHDATFYGSCKQSKT